LAPAEKFVEFGWIEPETDHDYAVTVNLLPPPIVIAGYAPRHIVGDEFMKGRGVSTLSQFNRDTSDANDDRQEPRLEVSARELSAQ